MKTTHKKQERYRCDYCKKLIAPKNEVDMTWIHGEPFTAFEDRWYHFCNRSQWQKAFDDAYQLRIGFAGDDDSPDK